MSNKLRTKFKNCCRPNFDPEINQVTWRTSINFIIFKLNLFKFHFAKVQVLELRVN